MRSLLLFFFAACGPITTVTLSPTPDIAELVTSLVSVLNKEAGCKWVHVGTGGNVVRVDYFDNTANYLIDASTEPVTIVMSRPSYRDAWDSHLYGKIGDVLGLDVDQRWNNDPTGTIKRLLEHMQEKGMGPCR